MKEYKLEDLINNPMMEYSYTNKYLEVFKYRYNPSNDSIEFTANTKWYKSVYGLPILLNLTFSKPRKPLKMNEAINLVINENKKVTNDIMVENFGNKDYYGLDKDNNFTYFKNGVKYYYGISSNEFNVDWYECEE